MVFHCYLPRMAQVRATGRESDVADQVATRIESRLLPQDFSAISA